METMVISEIDPAIFEVYGMEIIIITTQGTNEIIEVV